MRLLVEFFLTEAFLSVHLMNKKSTKTVPSTATTEWLMAEVNKVLTEEKENFLAVMNDKDFIIKDFIAKAQKVGAISKEGINKYQIVSDSTTWSLAELVEYLASEKENTGDLYLKISQQINIKK